MCEVCYKYLKSEISFSELSKNFDKLINDNKITKEHKKKVLELAQQRDAYGALITLEIIKQEANDFEGNMFISDIEKTKNLK